MMSSRMLARSLALRHYSSSAVAKNIAVKVDDQSGIATVTLQRPPVNSLNLDLLSEFSTALDELKQNKSKGMILTSSSDRVFSGGLDIMEMYKPDLERAKKFWTTLQEVWMKLYSSPYPTAAAIVGHSPAGGCLLAISCEYRVMLPNFTIGLNETRLGLAAPSFFVTSMVNTVGFRQAERALTTGTLFSTDEALKIGLIDDTATDRADCLAKAETFIKQFEKIDALARVTSKNNVRGKAVADLVKIREKDLQVFVDGVSNPRTQKVLDFYLASLKKK